MIKKIIASSFILMFLLGCQQEPVETPAIDLSSLFAQTCESAEGPCKTLTCTLGGEGYTCAESIAKQGENCVAKVAPGDEVLGSYQLCGEENAEELEVYNYSPSAEVATEYYNNFTPAELDAKIEEEVATVEAGGSSSFLSTMMAVAAGSLLAGAISNALMGRSNMMAPKNASGYSEPMNKDTLNQTKTEINNNQSKLDSDLKQSKTAGQNNAKKAAVARAKAASKTTTTKRSTSRRRR